MPEMVKSEQNDNHFMLLDPPMQMAQKGNEPQFSRFPL